MLIRLYIRFIDKQLVQRNAVSLIFPLLAALLCICCCYDLGYINAEKKKINQS